MNRGRARTSFLKPQARPPLAKKYLTRKRLAGQEEGKSKKVKGKRKDKAFDEIASVLTFAFLLFPFIFLLPFPRESSRARPGRAGA